MSYLHQRGSVARSIGSCICAIALLALLPIAPARADDKQPKFDAQAIEFFEKEVRPLLVKRCFECHGPDAKRLEGGLLMTNRANLLAGGDTGPAVVPGKVKESLLVDAINYGDLYEMPPKGKLPAAEIATLTKWVEMGAPWPQSASSGADPRKKFDLAARKKSHWAWQPIADPAPPKVKAGDWPLDPLDHFILARLEAEGLSPNPPADARTLARRLYFDIIGLPPTDDEIDRWVPRLTAPQREARAPRNALDTDSVKSDTLPDGSRLNENEIEKLVDRLLASPQFGERWGRHWLDLMRYAESRGHEFDYNAPNAWEYRDYVIRALNSDVPYDQFVTEHIAGDLLAKPRRHPEKGFNESIIATGFWHLGEWVHSPVDIRGDECDRQDNQLDVFGKAFLGMTIACARCHDHKFDAISQRDYYAMAGFLQSSAYRLARFETLEHNRNVAQELHELRQSTGRKLAQATFDAQKPVLEKFDKYLLAAREAIHTPVEKVGAAPSTQQTAKPIVFADFEDGTYGSWKIAGASFGKKPVTGTLPRQQQVSGFKGKFYINTYIGGDGSHGKAVSPEFTIERRYITMLVGGGAHAGQTCVNLVVKGKPVRTMTGKANERLDPAAWDVAELRGQSAHLEIVDTHSGGWGHLNLDHIVFTDELAAHAVNAQPKAVLPQEHVAAIAGKHSLAAGPLVALVNQLGAAKEDSNDPLHLWARLAFDKNQDETHLEQQAAAAVRELRRRTSSSDTPSKGADVIINFGDLKAGQWMTDGSAFGVAPQRIGEPLLSKDSQNPLAGFATNGAARRDLAFKDLRLAPGSMNDHGKPGGWQRVGQSVRTPTFTVKEGPVHYLVRGGGRAFAVVDSHRLVQGPLHGEVLYQWNDDNKPQPRWVTQNLTRHKGHRVHVEFSPHGAGRLEILMVAQGPRPPAIATAGQSAHAIAKAIDGDNVDSLQALADAYRDAFKQVANAGGSGFGDDASDDAIALADWMIRHKQVLTAKPADEELTATAKDFAAKEKELISQIKTTSRVAMAMWDGYAEDEYLLIRGNHGTTAGNVPRRIPTALGGADADQKEATGSGRLALAKSMVDASNPLTARVMANRVWHHLTGRGIVPTCDNFGVLGLPPTHPELLDHLANRLRREGWSTKRLIKSIVLSRTYQMSSRPSEAGQAKDPANELLHRMRIRRLEGEAIRDAVLAISGRADAKMYGAPVPVHLTAFMTGRGRPGQGPLDGAGRRSIYISIRRNFLSPMMLAFDMPQPSSSMGRRTVSNVPAQALIMMNDPLVIQQADLWAKKLLAEKDLSSEQRIAKMYAQAFARPPTDEETAAAIEFLTTQGARHGIPADKAACAPQAWADLCHVMFNVKEFIFVN